MIVWNILFCKFDLGWSEWLNWCQLNYICCESLVIWFFWVSLFVSQILMVDSVWFTKEAYVIANTGQRYSVWLKFVLTAGLIISSILKHSYLKIITLLCHNLLNLFHLLFKHNWLKLVEQNHYIIDKISSIWLKQLLSSINYKMIIHINKNQIDIKAK